MILTDQINTYQFLKNISKDGTLQLSEGGCSRRRGCSADGTVMAELSQARYKSIMLDLHSLDPVLL